MKVIFENTIIASKKLQKEKKSFVFAKIPLTCTLPSSLVVNLYLVMRIGVSGEISAEFSTSSKLELQSNYSLRYTEDRRWEGNGFCEKKVETSFKGNVNLELKAYFEPGIKVVFEQFRGVNAGAYVEQYLKFSAEYFGDKNKVHWELGGGTKIKAEAKIKLLGDNFINQDFESVFWEKKYEKYNEGTFTKVENKKSKIEITKKIDFGKIELNNPKIKTFTIKNTGTKDFNILDIKSSDENIFKIVNSPTGVLPPNKSAKVYVRFSPKQSKEYTGFILIENNADSGDNKIQLSGTGIERETKQSIIKITPNTINFNKTEVNLSNQKYFTVQNIGNKSLNVFDIVSSNNAFEVFNGQSRVLQPNESIKVYVTFKPKKGINYNGKITVKNNADKGENIVSLSGRGFKSISNNYSDLIVDNIRVKKYNDRWKIYAKIKNIGNISTPNNETIKIKYYINGNYVDYETINKLSSNESEEEYIKYKFTNGVHQIKVVVESVSNETTTYNNSKTVHFDNSSSSSNTISITPTNGCNDPKILEVNKVYQINISNSQYITNYTKAPPVKNQSYEGRNVRGFWLSFKVPTNKIYKVKIFDVSEKFDPLVSLYSNCSDFYRDIYKQKPFKNEQGKGGGEDYYGQFAPGYTYNIRIYHYNGNETPNINFKIKIE